MSVKMNNIEIVRINPISGEPVSKSLPMTMEQLWAWQNGAYVQDAFPHLSADDREFIISGLLPGQWEELFGGEEGEGEEG